MSNSLNNGLLPVVIPDELLTRLQSLILKEPGTKVNIDLDKQTFTINSINETFRFAINPYKKECLLKGLDDIDFLLSMKSLITGYETNKSAAK
jgi:3-isopropylmalate/(R)-2-methylmalate dehydratase small subunit